MKRILLVPVLGTLSLMALPACGGGSKPDPAVAEANKVFNERCANCHGPKGEGNGPGAAALDPKPRSFTSPGWQASVDDARIKKVVVEGGAALGLSEAMAPNPDLANKPDVLQALVIKIRKMQK